MDGYRRRFLGYGRIALEVLDVFGLGCDTTMAFGQA